MTRRSSRVLVAGIGNIFLGDDGFGVEVAARLAARELPEHVDVMDVGIRGIHLAFELLERPYETTIFVDALPRGGPPGTIYVVEPEAGTGDGTPGADAHAMTPEAVLGYLRSIGGRPGRVLIVGCEPETVDERMELSAPVAAAVDGAVQVVIDLATGGREALPAPGLVEP